MGYDVHITRASNWADNEGRQITADEWKSCLDADPELSPDPDNGPHSVLWRAHPEGREDAWLDWFGGNIYTTNPDGPLLEKMLTIARQLEAEVKGDDDRVYESVEDLVEGE